MNKNLRLQAMVTEDEHQAIKVWAVQNKISISELVTTALNEYFKKVNAGIKIDTPQWGGDRRAGEK